jgi:hypothetical protein
MRLAPVVPSDLLEECAGLDRLRRESENLYERVRALLFLSAIHRFHLPRAVGHARPTPAGAGTAAGGGA